MNVISDCSYPTVGRSNEELLFWPQVKPWSHQRQQRVPGGNPLHQQQRQVGGRRSLGKDSRQRLVIIDEVGHAEEFLDRLHHFGGFRSEQLAIQDQDLQGARPGGEVPLAPSPALLGHKDAFATPFAILEPNLP